MLVEVLFEMDYTYQKKVAEKVMQRYKENVKGKQKAIERSTKRIPLSQR